MIEELLDAWEDLPHIGKVLFGVGGGKDEETVCLLAHLADAPAGGSAKGLTPRGGGAPVHGGDVLLGIDVGYLPLLPEGIGRLLDPFRIVIGVPLADIEVNKADLFHEKLISFPAAADV